MSERFIFNHKLNKAKHNWIWLSLVVAGISCVSFNSAAQQVQPVLVDPEKKVASVFRSELTDLNFKRNSTGGARVTLDFNNADFQMQLSQGNQKLILTLPAVKLADDQLFTLDVIDFATQVSDIETFQETKGSKIEFKLLSKANFTHKKNGNQLVIEIEKDDQPEASKAESAFTGEPISLDFQDVPVRQVLQIIAQVNGFNLVTTDTVNGNVTISLSGVPWDQALEMILKIKGLDKRLEGNILLIAPSEELTARETQQLQSKQQVADLAPLSAVNIQINYAKAAEMAAILKSADASILSARGSVTIDERTNTVLLRDTAASVEEARALIKALDIPIKQVLIESRMVTVRDNVDEQLGVRWGISDSTSDGGISGSLEGANDIAAGIFPDLADRLNVNLPVSNPAGSIGIQIARLVDGTIIDLELSALETENKGEIIASPRITVANQQEAYIEQGTEIPYVQATSSGATSVEFKKAVLSLKVTPHITPDNRVILDLVVTQDTRGETVSTSTGPAVAIDTQEISTQVLVENGETIVLGGIFQQTSTDDVSKIPLLGDLPVVGSLFRNSQKVNEKRELLIFVTPKILVDSL
ncbi:type IV pilus secretin PilQ family protein [Aliiglaciecola sp. 2_MG-2023]|uniref:type IV pilus secretin PilQ n=1 Tax=unclassified Aliiglaciecola TaxID=2593648 RepID=UPI0026E466AD|nr:MULTISPECIES: type IV pilus secretin PilQ family protein [unclassified Aliiglaciecola]MDO6709642.1 type IV pilus secretin PilQ family protein [Aliiglaciecola sp. 2_MG-2023]MDO6750816.1 type IV pilus secretin PilQ family protein [Aliiglaciecola sp. 1_MG-2023]